LGKIAENAISGKAWHTELPETLAGNFILGSAADGLGKLGKHLATSAWGKHGDSISAGGMLLGDTAAKVGGAFSTQAKRLSTHLTTVTDDVWKGVSHRLGTINFGGGLFSDATKAIGSRIKDIRLDYRLSLH
jgi:hypothetical protein